VSLRLTEDPNPRILDGAEVLFEHWAAGKSPPEADTVNSRPRPDWDFVIPIPLGKSAMRFFFRAIGDQARKCPPIIRPSQSPE
jgi:hypothetical protein